MREIEFSCVENFPFPRWVLGRSYGGDGGREGRGVQQGTLLRHLPGNAIPCASQPGPLLQSTGLSVCDRFDFLPSERFVGQVFAQSGCMCIFFVNSVNGVAVK